MQADAGRAQPPQRAVLPFEPPRDGVAGIRVTNGRTAPAGRCLHGPSMFQDVVPGHDAVDGPSPAREDDLVHPVVESKRAEIAALCRRLGVRTLDVFGSAVGDDFDPERSDVDVLVEVAPEQLTMANYFELRAGLVEILGRPVDVVDIGAMRNPYFAAQVMATREALYAA